MKINFAHIRDRSTSGDWFDFAVFEANSASGSNTDNNVLLSQLTDKARSSGLKIDQAALAYQQNSRLHYFGSKHLVEYLSQHGVPKWTHSFDV